MNRVDEIHEEPWRFDWFTVMRWLERSRPDKPRIGDAASRRDDFVRMGQTPHLDFPASNLESFARRPDGTCHLQVKFLGMTGPQGPLPLAVTEEAKNRLDQHEDGLARFFDILNHRFLQLFYRAWADARPIAQFEQPKRDRFGAYVGSFVGMGTPLYRDLDKVPDLLKLGHAGLAAPTAKSAVRLEALFLGILGLRAEIEEFVGSRLPVEPEDRTRLGRCNAALGTDAMTGASVYSVGDKICVHLRTRSLAEYQRVLPSGDLAEPIADLMTFYLGESFEWDVEPALPARDVVPIRLGKTGRLGWTTWLAPAVDPTSDLYRADARFNLAERVRGDGGRDAAPPSRD